MKSLSVILFLFLSLVVSAQDYQHICPPGKLLFKDYSNNLKAFRRDSAVSPGNNDTIFYSYRTIIDTGGQCRDTINGSILGRKVLKRANGLFCFFNSQQDSVFINSQAGLNQSWKFFILSSNDYIQATVTAMVTDSIAGLTDLMKVITFQAKDQSGNNISHPLNGKTIRLSKDYGLATMLDVYRVPDDTVIYALAGISSLDWGISDISWKEVYNYDVGDVFHYKITTNWWWFYQSTIINRIIAKTDYGGQDSVSYLVEYCQRWDGIHPPYYDVKSDTVTVKYNFLQLNSEQPFMMSEEFTRTEYPPYYSEKLGFPGLRLIYGIMSGETEYYPEDNCYGISFEGSLGETDYAKGLGTIKSHMEWWENYALSIWDESLVYYQKGSETWGTPVAADCDVLTGFARQLELQERSISAIPNPAETEVNISISGKKSSGVVTYSLYNSLGAKVIAGNAETNPFAVSLKELPAGVYLLIVADPNGDLAGTSRIIRK